MHRLARLGLGIGLVVVLITVIGGQEQGGRVPVTAVPTLAVGAIWLGARWWLRRRPARVDGWHPAAAVAYQRAATRPPASAGSVAAALSRVEVRELVTSTSFGLGLGLCLLLLWQFGLAYSSDFGGHLPAVFELTPLLVHPLAGLVVLAAFRARTRGRRDRVEELFATCPVPAHRRTQGHLLTAWAPAGVGLAVLATLVAMVAVRSNVAYGEVGARQVTALLGAGLLCVGATFLGVALARWTPWTIAPVAAVVGIGFLATDLATAGRRTTEPLRQLSTALIDPEIDIRLTAPHWLAHHLWILGLVGIVAALALLRDVRRPALALTGCAALVLAVVSATYATRPVDGHDAERIAAILTDPSRVPCSSTHGFEVCTFAADEALATTVTGAIEPVLAAAPADAAAGWRVHQLSETDWDDLDPEVRAITGPPPDRERIVPVELTGHPAALEGLRIWAGLAATGVLDDWVEGTNLGVRGQARGAIALWLATRGADASTQHDLTSSGARTDSNRDRGRPWPDSCFAGSGPVVWAASDVAAARAMLALPDAEVRDTLHAGWDRYVDRDTTTDDLLRDLGLAPTGVEGQTRVAEC